MPKIDAEDCAKYAYKAGVHGQLDLATAVAIASLESDFETGAKADDADDQSYGLWQINMKGSLGPSRRAKYNLANNEALYDPATNARVMAALSENGKKWGAWSTFTYGPAKVYALRYMGVASKVIDAGGGGGVFIDIVGGAQNAVDGATAVAGAAADASQALRAAHAWISDRRNIIRVAYVVVGGAILIGALLSVTRSAIDVVPTPVKTLVRRK